MDLTSLRQLIQTHPLIDNHAHNLLEQNAAASEDDYPLKSIVSEAHGRALDNALTTLPLIRATNQLSELYGTLCSNWTDVEKAHAHWVQSDYQGLVRRSLEGTHTLLLDDLLTDDDVEPYSWHDQFTGAATKRIVRIEAVAASLLVELMDYERKPDETVWGLFRARFLAALDSAMDDPAVVGFKSVVCYRTGLDVDPYSADEEALTASLHRTLDSGTKRSGYRVEDKALNDWLVQQTLKAITFKKRAGIVKPLQFHTGLGDNDINLVRANPAYLQPLIDQYQDADIILLHSAYPYTREAGYLASVYPNVYLDLGEVFPMVSRDGQEKLLRESLEIAPLDRLLWSTDGHFHPETFWLANCQFRQALEKVLVEYVQCGDMNVEQAKTAAIGILFENSNKIYNLNASVNETKFGFYDPPSVMRITQTQKATTDPLDALLQKYPDLKYIWMQWIDYTATTRVRIFPIAEFKRIAPKAKTDRYLLGGMLDVAGRHRSARGFNDRATIMTFWRSERNEVMDGCPRTTLENIVQKLRAEHRVEVLCGFEIEVVFLRPQTDETGMTTNYAPATRNHSWSQMTSDTRIMVPILEEINEMLASMGINLQQFHAESAPGQFEFILPPATPLAAVDALYAARQVVTNIAEKHSLRATFHPRPIASGAGSAAHTHISINKPEREDAFLAGILNHYPAIAAFTLSQDASYERVRSGIWAGSEWVAWGFQNREAPVRKIGAGYWEFKSVDGVANTYLAVAALLAGGYIGLNTGAKLTVEECTVDASSLSASERAELGIRTPLPKTLTESLEALEEDVVLWDLMGPKLVRNYIAVKRAESECLRAVPEAKRRLWLLERY
ncbi:hypothetical protein N7532_001603 [Penicillium argentinense]|uniref:GS catalytic domain-containing protein n=1 Tax=Penicillium argentinense TaxID=1131581 RepID=A0A9W9G2X2_9EURO|nr:uncharacterized protein N7532_001603 [Penicillium argentinense]KAJ5111068.1 hypothetical protein N7532_001603 [Penicillium argentinense]